MRRTSLLAGLGLFLFIGLVGAVNPPAIQKQPPPMPAPPKMKEFELKLVRVGKSFQGIRYKVTSGEAWVIETDKYVKLTETGPVPAGDYDITLVTDDANWMAFRLDRVSGASWMLRDKKWVRIKEPEEKDKAKDKDT